MEDSFKKGEALGGYTRKNEGFEAAGRYCITFTCMVPVLALPVIMEIDDKHGPLERFDFSPARRSGSQQGCGRSRRGSFQPVCLELRWYLGLFLNPPHREHPP